MRLSDAAVRDLALAARSLAERVAELERDADLAGVWAKLGEFERRLGALERRGEPPCLETG